MGQEREDQLASSSVIGRQSSVFLPLSAVPTQDQVVALWKSRARTPLIAVVSSRIVLPTSRITPKTSLIAFRSPLIVVLT
jgi:hypothetical protein